MLWIKALHISFVVAWFAGLFYLPRLFVYHADTHDEPGQARFQVMERRLLILMHIAAAGSLASGAWLMAGWWWPPPAWLHAKLVLVALLVAYHAWCVRLAGGFASGRNRRSARWYRVFNEVPSLLLLGSVFLVVLKPGG